MKVIKMRDIDDHSDIESAPKKRKRAPRAKKSVAVTETNVIASAPDTTVESAVKPPAPDTVKLDAGVAQTDTKSGGAEVSGSVAH